MTEAEWLACTDPTPMLVEVGDRGSARKLYLVGLACMRRLFKLKSDGVAAVAALEAAAEAADPDAAVRALHAAHPRFGFDRGPLDWAMGSAAGPSGYKGKERSPPLIRDILGNPFRPVAFSPAWRTSTAAAIAQGVYDASDFAAMPILADALQDAGCDDEAVLAHCRDATVAHVRGCWVVDLVLGKA